MTRSQPDSSTGQEADLHQSACRLRDQLACALAGKDEVIRNLLITLFCGGHLLIEDLPGVGKTTLAHALARSLDSDFGRIQFTADLLPADIVGVEIFDPAQNRFVFHPGAIFHHILLADEINRATPKAQSALLEAMAEGQVTIERETRPLPHPFLVIATQNPLEQAGTFPLPESQLDRFFMRIEIGYPDREAERRVLTGEAGAERLEAMAPVADWKTVAAIRRAVARVHTAEPLLDYLLALLAASRDGRLLRQGISPRAGRELLRAAQACAWLDRRDFVTAADLQRVWLPCLAHRVTADGDSVAALSALREQVPVPG
ncbi:MAG: AAA family ATPase [Zetaproteobacteria bacterium]|nr:MAG: AAA family ATPase [Zetaproteobacteria bacterium]